MAAPQSKPTAERERQALNGWLALLLVVLWFVAAIALFISTGVAAEAGAISARGCGVPRTWARS